MSANTQKSRLKDLIARGKEQGYLTYAEVNDHLPEDIADPDQVEDIIQMINDMGIQVTEVAPDADDLLITDGDSSADETAAAEAAAALAAVESDAGRTTDPVRMYMREMGSVELLTREGEIVIAKRIEEGIRDVMAAVAHFPGTVAAVINNYDNIIESESRISDLVSGFLDPEGEEPELPDSKSDPSPPTPTSWPKKPPMRTRKRPRAMAAPIRRKPAGALNCCGTSSPSPWRPSQRMAAPAR